VEPLLYSIKSVAERLNVSKDTVRRLISDGELGQLVRIGRNVRIQASELEAFLALGGYARPSRR
jgi:excisionase family DNA binding protein